MVLFVIGLTSDLSKCIDITFLLVAIVVFLFFSSSCSVSSHQYYVTDDCSSVTHTPYNSLSVYTQDASQYNNMIFHFIGTSSMNNNFVMTAVKNVTLHGLHHSSHIACSNYAFISIHNSSYVMISNISISDCQVSVRSSTNITITDSFLYYR